MCDEGVGCEGSGAEGVGRELCVATGTGGVDRGVVLVPGDGEGTGDGEGDGEGASVPPGLGDAVVGEVGLALPGAELPGAALALWDVGGVPDGDSAGVVNGPIIP